MLISQVYKLWIYHRAANVDFLNASEVHHFVAIVDLIEIGAGG